MDKELNQLAQRITAYDVHIPIINVIMELQSVYQAYITADFTGDQEAREYMGNVIDVLECFVNSVLENTYIDAAGIVLDEAKARAEAVFEELRAGQEMDMREE